MKRLIPIITSVVHASAHAPVGSRAPLRALWVLLVLSAAALAIGASGEFGLP
jgi:hypothetical protein